MKTHAAVATVPVVRIEEGVISWKTGGLLMKERESDAPSAR